MASKPSKDAERRARLEALRREESKRRQRRLYAILGSAVAVALVVVFGIVWFASRDDNDTPAVDEGRTSYFNLSRDHVEGAVRYDQTPPAGGEHSAQWQNCGIYTSPVLNENAVHSLEHGAFWITYQPDLPADQVKTLQDDVRDQPYGLLSPSPDLPTPVVATVWGTQLRLQDASDPKLAAFIDEYADATKAPEPRGECTGGVGTPQ